MSSRPAPMQPRFKPRPTGNGGRVLLLLLLFAGALLAAASPAMALLAAIGLGPTIALACFETGRPRASLPCLAAMNIAGLLPVLVALWRDGASLRAGVSLLTNPYTWLIVYGAAAAAYALLWIAPRLVREVLEAAALLRRDRYERRQAELLEEWGAEVAGQPAEAKAPSAGPIG